MDPLSIETTLWGLATVFQSLKDGLNEQPGVETKGPKLNHDYGLTVLHEPGLKPSVE